jgi:D-glycero-D-manno-heptose 1,7-bisphosphate phosphatase
MPTEPLRPAVLFDRDGVIIENNPNYVRSVAEVSFIPGALEALAALARARPGWRFIIATNQAGIGWGVITQATLAAIHRHVVEHIVAAGGRIDQVYVCPHRPEENCPCRKPAPGLLRQAAAEWGIHLPASVMIGDSISDVQAALAAGATPILVQTGLGVGYAQDLRHAGLEHVPVLADISAAIEWVLNRPDHTNAP